MLALPDAAAGFLYPDPANSERRGTLKPLISGHFSSAAEAGLSDLMAAGNSDVCFTHSAAALSQDLILSLAARPLREEA